MGPEVSVGLDEKEWKGIKERADAHTLPSILAAKHAVTALLDLSNELRKLHFAVGSNIELLNRAVREAAGQITAASLDLNQNLRDLRHTVSTFSNSTTALTKQANRLIAWYVGLTAVIVFFGGVNLYFSNELKQESVRANEIEQQPFLDFVGDRGVPVRIANKGKGAALNIVLLHWNNLTKKLYIVPEENVGTALAPDKEGAIDLKMVQETNVAEVSKRIPAAAVFISQATEKNITWFALVYQDLQGHKFVTLMRGVGGEYDKAVEFQQLSE